MGTGPRKPRTARAPTHYALLGTAVHCSGMHTVQKVQRHAPAVGLTPDFLYSSLVSRCTLSLSSPYRRLSASIVGLSFCVDSADSTCATKH